MKAAAATLHAQEVNVYERGRTRGSSLAVLWARRDLVLLLASRDLRVRYRQTAFGIIWALLQPSALALVIAAVFSRIAGQSNGVPYPLVVYAALLPWQAFAHGLSYGSTSLVTNERVVTRVAFPRLVIPLAVTLTGLVDAILGAIVLVVLMISYRLAPTPFVLIAPLFLIMASLAGFTFALWLGPANVRYRDARHALPLLVQLWFFSSPIVYLTSAVPVRWAGLYELNPVVGIIEGFRWVLFGGGAFPSDAVLISAAITALVLVFGLRFFRRAELTFADVT